MATSDQVQQLYITYFGRPADPSGLAYWTADSETPLSVIADGFATTPEFAADIEGRTLDQIVNSFYVDLFGRNAEPAGLQFWVSQIQSGNTTIQQVGLEISNAALTPEALGNSDNVALVSKIAASNQWTTTVAASTEATLAYTGNVGIDAGVNYLLPVLTTATIPTEAATEAQIDALIQENGSGAGSTLELSIFADVATDTGTVRLDNNGSIQETSAFRFTAGNETVNGTATTFSGAIDLADRLVDGFTTDQDVLNVTGLTTSFAATGPSAIGTQATVTNIENINLTFASANDGGPGATALAATGVQRVTAAGSIANAGQLGLSLNGTGASTFTSTLTGNATSVFTFVGDTGVATAVTTSDVADNITTDTGNDTIVSAGGNDVINSGAGNDSIESGDGGDNVTAAAGNDTINGGAGNDTINGGAGSDVMDGGAGVNQFLFNAVGDVGADETVTFSGTDSFIVGAAVNFTTMNDGGSLNGLNAVVLNAAGATFDAAQLTGITAAVDGTIGANQFNITTANNNGVTVNFSGLTLSNGADANITGGNGDDTITATSGATATDAIDTLNGGAGNDTLNANARGNALNGNAGDDTLVGGAGADTITGGVGADRLTGNGGADLFIWAAGDSGQTVATADRITDYITGTDIIQTAAGAGNLVGLNTVAPAAATAGVASILAAANGVATFAAADDTFAERIIAVAGGLAGAGGNDAAGASVVFAGGDVAANFLFVSDGVTGVTAGDYLAQLDGVTIAAGITVAGGNITAIA